VESKVALVTGAAKGIGAACAKRLAKDGFRVAIHYRSNPDLALSLKAELPESEVFCYDLATEGACEALVKEIKSKMGRLDVVVNNAGIALDQIITFAKPEDFDKTVHTNVKPAFMISKFASKLMLRNKWGRIVNITSVVGHLGNAGQVIYSGAKGAITGMTKSMAMDLAGFGITCNCVAPGFIATDMTDSLPDEVKQKMLTQIPLARFGHPDDVANAVSFLVSEGSGYVTGTTIHVNGGMYRS
jgi:3-oxoacyl-[acyl-carrier protein] reductase